jgi:hypothetical protein
MYKPKSTNKSYITQTKGFCKGNNLLLNNIGIKEIVFIFSIKRNNNFTHNYIRLNKRITKPKSFIAYTLNVFVS